MVLKDREVVVTGGAGFIGSHVVDALVEENDVTVVDNLSAGSKELVNPKADFEKVDVRNKDDLKPVMKDSEVVFHFAADARTRSNNIGWDNPVENAEINAIGTLNLLRAVDELDIDPKVVFASSAAVYGPPENPPIDEEHPKNPVSPYGIHKLAGEKYMRAFNSERGLDTSSIRIFNTYGPRQLRYVMYDFLKKLQKDNSVLEVLGTGRQVRDYCYIDDTVEAFLTVAENGEPGEEYNVSGENVISIGELAELIIDLTGLDAEIEYTEESWEGDISRLEADISKIKKLGFEP
ncbi:MAG: NAD-dependent epimerase/dehydratase family protein, partial [Candidatus Nanohaloarchaea archaeon]|nr:NAD-dependent epimerase/dehydratase family protein [Candidatus Nanohaloarchaea archaeon]